VNVLKKILSIVYTVWVFIIFTGSMIIFLPGIVLPFLFGERSGWLGYKFLWIWAWVFDKLTGIRYHLIGGEFIEKGKSYIFVSNHTSFLDAPGVRLMIPGEFKPLAKKELGKIPILGLIVRSACIIVDRGDHNSRKKSISKLIEVLKRGISPLIFAEGTQNRTKELLQPFKDGAFRIAIDTQTDILPMVVIGASKLMYPGDIIISSPGVIRVVAGNPIAVQDFGNDMAALKQHTFEVMTKLMLNKA
jgi:1-acyl-sn-glycerol-3-phosphate acyltransferase